MVLIATVCPSVSAGEIDPIKAFDAVFRPLEQAMGIDIKAANLKMNILSGQVQVGKVSISHPEQGNFAVAKAVRFPFAALAGLSNPSQASTTVDELNVKINFAEDKFWKVKGPDGGPIPGAPNLKMGNLGIAKGRIQITNGDGPSIELDGFSGSISKLKLPGNLWSKGKVPSSRWVELEFAGGTLQSNGLPMKIKVSKASFHFTSSTFHVTQFEGALDDGGKITLAGSVDMTSGKPKGYDLVIKLQEVPLDRPGLTAVATGTLIVKGPAGNVKVGGKLDLDEVDKLRAENWTREGCDDKVKLSVSLVPTADSGFEAAKLLGSLCRGRITTD
jgi:hypothetical protein